MRIVLFTGKGGVGKTSMAAATAVAASRSGRRTLVMSTDPAHSLSDAFDLPVGHDPVELERSLFAQQIDSQKRLEENWREIQDYAVEFLAWTGMTGIHAEELAVIPGLDEIFSLADIKRHHDSGDYDLLVVDCAPTAETVRLLSLPEAMAWYIEKLFPIERKIVRIVRPIFDRMRSLPPFSGTYANLSRDLLSGSCFRQRKLSTLPGRGQFHQGVAVLARAFPSTGVFCLRRTDGDILL